MPTLLQLNQNQVDNLSFDEGPIGDSLLISS